MFVKIKEELTNVNIVVNLSAKVILNQDQHLKRIMKRMVKYWMRLIVIRVFHIFKLQIN